MEHNKRNRNRSLHIWKRYIIKTLPQSSKEEIVESYVSLLSFFLKKKQKLIFVSIKNIPIYSVDFLPLKSLFKILAQLLSSESACFGGASCWRPHLEKQIYLKK